MSKKAMATKAHAIDEQQSSSIIEVQHQLKAQAYKRSLTSVRKQLPEPARTASSIIHHPVIEAINSLLAVTIGRPVSLALGAILSLIGSCVAIYFCKHYGIPYNYTTAPGLFTAGYVLGLLVEFVSWLVRRTPRY